MFDTPPGGGDLDPTSARTSQGDTAGSRGVELIIRDELEGWERMRRYDDPVDVRKGMVTGTGGARLEGPEQFMWRGRLWKVCDVVGHWVETGAWWKSPEATAVPGEAAPDLLAEREVWRVEAARGQATGRGVFDLVFDWADGTWQLVRCAD